MLDTSSSAKARAAPPAPSLPIAHPNSFPTALWICVLAAKTEQAILASALQFRLRLDLDRRTHVVWAYSVIWSATVSCQLLEIESAQNSTAFSTRSRLRSLADWGDGFGGCRVCAERAGLTREVWL